MLRVTHTYAILDLSPAAVDEIATKLRAAGYHHAFHDDVIDMHGIAVRAEHDQHEQPTAKYERTDDDRTDR